ncbi:alpha-hydroxy acid oxidase [Luteipulveratus halotolerans]|uniref:alpha-hydroxy acid oxidase n=1 Tax=Luteipulveratus halotolerans TaxID=1631356 RepID=UPI0018D067C0|nr:alpha-hydroxy acid oxidase [Luteipulveratus halotolerans]
MTASDRVVPPLDIAVLRQRAQALLPPAVWDYIETGAGAETSLDEAENAWHRWRFRPHVLRDVRTVDTSTTLYGDRLALPVVVAPTASHGLYHPDGERASVAGAGASGAAFCVSTRTSRTFEDVAAAATGPWWMQVYVTAARDITEAMVGRCVDAGASALVLTGDTPYVSRRARAEHAAALVDAAADDNLGRHLTGRDISALAADPGITTEQIRWLHELSGLPVLVKGVLRGDDATACLDAGAEGIVVSNHGARQLDRVVPTASALPEVVAAVGGRAPVLVDGGLRNAYDVLVALALGADAVLLGRPAIYALACGGADGVRDLLTALQDDLAHLMGLAGAPDLAALDPSYVVASG